MNNTVRLLESHYCKSIGSNVLLIEYNNQNTILVKIDNVFYRILSERLIGRELRNIVIYPNDIYNIYYTNNGDKNKTFACAFTAVLPILSNYNLSLFEVTILYIFVVINFSLFISL